MKKKTDSNAPSTHKAQRLALRKEILRNLDQGDLAQAAGGMYGQEPPGPCPRSKAQP
jgi:hypothetical protein